jgi:hypothetical protein
MKRVDIGSLSRIALVAAAAAVALMLWISRSNGIERQREFMRAAAEDYPAGISTGICGAEVPTTMRCSPGSLEFFCSSRKFVDPFEVWRNVDDYADFERLIYSQMTAGRSSMKELGEWFACQGFNVGIPNYGIPGPKEWETLLGSVEKVGRSPMRPSWVPVSLSWGLTFSITKKANGEMVFIAANGK